MGQDSGLKRGSGKRDQGHRRTEGQDRDVWDPAGRREKSCRARGMLELAVLEAMAGGAPEAAP